MKQLLHCCQGACVVALQDRAFLVYTHVVVELEAPATKEDGSENPIQAVAVTRHDSVVWCAVSRWNKSLALYRVECHGQQDTAFLPGIQPTTVHSCPKRVACLCFARVPATPEDTGSFLPVVITGDLTGDAWAWPLQEPRRRGRLLLGHTASMLTGIHCVDNANDNDNSNNNLLLTSDRDEKIRISAFPNTSMIHGFLLGHQAYVSAMDVVKTLCVTCSGDGTVRLWDCTTMIQVALWSHPTCTSSTSNTDTQIPSRVAMNPHGNLVAVIYDQCSRMDILRIHADPETGGQQLQLLQSLECPHQPLGLAFTTTNHDNPLPLLLVTMKDPSYLQVYQPTPSDDATSFQPVDLPAWTLLQKRAREDQIVMPDSVLEKDKQGLPTLTKSNETRGGAGATHKSIQEMSWNDPKRIDIAKERMRRSKRRRLEKNKQQQQQQQQQQPQQQEQSSP